ncbi:MAG: hypothetical protein KC486_08780 [Myxococcales bacterium]|jgi:hypothetical protein|nr:hypothetical protein [Myxococcales bacterium]
MDRPLLIVDAETGEVVGRCTSQDIPSPGAASSKSKVAAGKKKTAAKAKSASKKRSSRKAKASGKRKEEAKASEKPKKPRKEAESSEEPREAEAKKPKRQSATEKRAKQNKRPATAKTWNLDDAKEQARFDAAVLKAVKEGAVKAAAIPPIVGGTEMQAIGALGRLENAGELEIVKRGPPAQYRPVRALTGKAGKKKQELPSLRWRAEKVNGRRAQVARWDDGVFRMIELSSGKWALFFEEGEDVESYGCGASRTVKKEARLIAAAGRPSPEAWKAMDRKLGDCPITTRRVTEAKGVKLEWEESIRGGRKVCVAPTQDGDFEMKSAEDGSFALIFLRPGGKVENLGCGSMGTVQRRALEVVQAQTRGQPEEVESEVEEVEEAEEAEEADATATVNADVATEERPDADAEGGEGEAEEDDVDTNGVGGDDDPLGGIAPSEGRLAVVGEQMMGGLRAALEGL